MIEISSGFLPLTDSAILIIAKEMGFAEEEGISLNLVRETSWANVRDRLAVGQFEIAHCLAPIPIASNLGLSMFSKELIAPMALGLGGNAITVSKDVYSAMQKLGDTNPLHAAETGNTLARLVAQRFERGGKRLKFGVVHPFSAHNFELRYWLAAVGVRPDIDVDIAILPPPLMADALAAGQIDGFCVGEPWNSVAKGQGAGQVITVKSAIWASSPEKVLAVSADWANENEQSLFALINALYRAAKWCSDKNKVETLAHVLSQPQYLNVATKDLMPGLSGSIVHADDDATLPSFLEPFEGAATFPWQSHALWLYSQMVRWGQVEHSRKNTEIARTSFRPDLYRSALAGIDAAIPTANSKVEGALKKVTPVGAASQSLYLGPDGFFDDKAFDPDQIDTYIQSQSE